MCLIAPQQNHTDSPLCYAGGSPPRVTAFGSLRFASLRHPKGGSFKDVALFQFTETFLHSSQRRSNEGFYALCDQQLTTVYELTDLPQPHSVRTAKELSSFTMVGFSPQGSSPVALSTEGGLVYTGLIPSRDDDKLGISFCYAQLGSGYINAGNADGFPGTGFEAVTELSYLMQVTPAL